MKRLARWLFTSLCIFAALLSLTVCVIYIRSLWVGDYWHWYDAEGITRGLQVGNGRVRYGWADHRMMSGSNLAPGYYRSKPMVVGASAYLRTGTTHFDFAGLRYDHTQREFQLVEVHLIWPFLISAILPALWVLRWIRRRRFDQLGMCPACGYDLRASPDRCPECGTLAMKAGAT